MKTLALQQPWASLVASGIKKIENRSWTTPYRGRVLIVASGRKVPTEFILDQPVEWYCAMYTEQIFGNLPESPDLPVGAIIGYADLVDVTQGVTEDVWDNTDDGCYKWHFENARLLDKPIPVAQAGTDLYDTPEVTEDNLPPAHRVALSYPRLEGTTLVLPIARVLIEESRGYECFHFPIDQFSSYAKKLLKPRSDHEMVKVTEVRFVSGAKQVVHRVKSAEVTVPIDEDGNDINIFSLRMQGYSCIPEFYFEFK